MSVRTSIVALVLGGLGACAPELDDQLWRCESHADCGGGFLCDGTAGHCVAALSNADGVFDDRIVLGMSAALGNDVSLGQVGLEARIGLLACFHHVNRTGGVHGRTLQLDGVKIDSKRLEISHEVAGELRRTKVLKCDVYAEKVKLHSPKSEDGTRDRVVFERCWFRYRTDPREIHEQVLEDTADDPRNAASVVLGKVNARPLELGGLVTR